MSIIQAIAIKRQKLLDGIEANEGDISLRIFEDFYPDEAHFIYELLQNAEDAGAAEVAFELTQHGCSFEHNGARHFDERDIRGITGIFNSSKKEKTDKIGKFGVGFKSVFVYTDSPIVFSKNHSFKIVKLVLPVEVTPKKNLGQQTRFELPFNNPKKNVKAAHAEIKAGLDQLSETTLLFLKNIKCIKWKIDNKNGEILRIQHSEHHIEVRGVINGKEVFSSHWLCFTSPVQEVENFSSAVEGIERQQVAVAYEMKFIGGIKSFDESKPISQQFKINPAKKGQVSVFFPAEKETSGLRFHLHGPFIPELSRASIKNSPQNLPIFKQISVLAANSLTSIRDLGLLTGEFLSVLPNNHDSLPERYRLIRDAIIGEMKISPLVPTYTGRHAPVSSLFQSRRSQIKALLSKEDLAFLTERSDGPEWAIGASQRNSNQDRFLSSLNIPEWDAQDLVLYLEEKLREPKEKLDSCEVSKKTRNWISSKSFEWIQSLYSLLLNHCEELGDFGYLHDVYFIPLASKNWGNASISFFQNGSLGESDHYDRVDHRVLTDGSKKAQQEDARRFLELLGVREPSETDELEFLLRLRYKEGANPPADIEYLSDLERMISFLEKYPYLSDIFESANVFKVASISMTWASAKKVYLDEPFMHTGLYHLYKISKDQNLKRWPVDDWYKNCGIKIERVIKFAVLLGCQKEFNRISVDANCKQNTNWSAILSKAPGEREGNVINRDFSLSPESMELIKSKDIAAVQLFWRALCRAESIQSNILQAIYQITDKGGPRTSISQLVFTLRDLEWVPQTGGLFVKPSQALASRLPKGFPVDAGYKWLEAVQFGFDEKKKVAESAINRVQREKLGFKSEEALQRALEFNELSLEEQDAMLAQARQRRTGSVELPVREVRNPEIRAQRVVADARVTPDKSVATKMRSVQLGVSEAKIEAKVYLQDQYTNANGQMICQVCKDELPFKLSSGSYYFEAVELIENSTKRYRSTYLALCPNHAAAYQYANGQRSVMVELISTASTTEVEIDLGGQDTTIYFTQMHLGDAKACLEADSE